MRARRRYVIGSLLVALASASAPFISAQKGPEKSAHFTAQTELIEVPVLVRRDGKHVAGLRAGEFTLLADGKPQPIASVEEVHGGLAVQAADTESAPVQAQEAALRPRLTIFALDGVNTFSLDRAYFLREFDKYVAEHSDDGTLFGLVSLERSGVRVLHDFTTDLRALQRAVHGQAKSQTGNHGDVNQHLVQLDDSETASPSPAVRAAVTRMRVQMEDMSRFQDHTAKLDTLLAFQQLAAALKGIPGRKTLLYIGSGFKFVDRTPGGKRSSQLSRLGEALDQQAYTLATLNDANVAVYPIDSRGVTNSAAEVMDVSNTGALPKPVTHAQAGQNDVDRTETLYQLAAYTGGRACFNRTDLANCLRDAVDDDRDYYVLGFYLPKGLRQVGWHKLEVKLNSKAALRYREGFMIVPVNEETARKQDVALALNSPVPYTGLPLRAEFEAPVPGDGKSIVPFVLQVPPQALAQTEAGKLDLSIAVIARAEGGKEADHVFQNISRQLPSEAVAQVQSEGITYRQR